jgi:nucleoid DNA-binding protein
MNWSDNIDKRRFWRYVNKKINHLINHAHVLSVISILFEEILKDLKDGKQIKIRNLGTLILQRTKPRKYYNVVFQQIMQSESHQILRFKLATPIHKILRALLDINKTFSDKIL